MKLMRDESGAMLIFAPTDIETLPASSESTPTVPAKVERPPARASVPRAVTQHCRFHCRWCGSMILLSHDQIGLPFASPFLRRIEVRAVASVCESCGHVAAYSLFSNNHGYDAQDSLIPAQSRGITLLADWLKCEEKTCASALPLFLSWPGPLTADAVKGMAGRWLWDDLTCAAGHRILMPLWVLGRAPYQLPEQLR